MPLTYNGQFDWSQEHVVLGGVEHKIKVAHFRLCHSRKPFVVAYPGEAQEKSAGCICACIGVLRRGAAPSNYRQSQGQALFADDTPVKLLSPGNKRTKTARVWAYVRDERPWDGLTTSAGHAGTDNPVHNKSAWHVFQFLCDILTQCLQAATTLAAIFTRCAHY